MDLREYREPRYNPDWEHNWAFTEYKGERGHFFIDLKYRIDKNYFKSRRANGEPALDFTLRDYENGDLIFGDMDVELLATIKARGYRLLEESDLVPIEGRLCEVTETYGYSPDKEFDGISFEIIQGFGRDDPSGATSNPITLSGNEYNLAKKEFKINMGTPEIGGKYFSGDSVYIYGDGDLAGDNLVGLVVPVIRTDGKWVYIGSSTFTVTWTNTVLGEWDFENALNNRHNNTWWKGIIRLVRDSTVRKPAAVQLNVYTYTKFYDAAPDTEQRDFPTDGNGTEVDSFTAATKPTIAEWKTKIAARETYIPSEAEIEPFMGSIYKVTRKRAPCR